MVARKEIKLTAAKNRRLKRIPDQFAISPATGAPSTIPAETPTMTLETAFGTSDSCSAKSAAAASANETYTGWKNAGITLANKSIGKLTAKAAATLQTVKSPNTKTMIFFRANLDNSIGMTGPESAMARANILTSNPAVVRFTPYCSEIAGRIPTTPISVFNMLNTPTANISKLLFFKISTPLF